MVELGATESVQPGQKVIDYGALDLKVNLVPQTLSTSQLYLSLAGPEFFMRVD